MKKLTRTKREAIRKHRKYWKRIANETPYRPKPSSSDVINDCYFCHYTVERQEGRIVEKSEWIKPHYKSCVKFCPGLWKDPEGLVLNSCEEQSSLYSLWSASVNQLLSTRYALAIANIEIRKETR